MFSRKLKLPKSVMEKIKRPNEEEVRRLKRRLQEEGKAALDKIDWGILEKHLHTPEARDTYKLICKQLHTNFLEDAPSIVLMKEPDPYSRFYYEHFPPKHSFKDVMLLKWTQGKTLIKRMSIFVGVIVVSAGLGFASGKHVVHSQGGKLSSV